MRTQRHETADSRGANDPERREQFGELTDERGWNVRNSVLGATYARVSVDVRAWK